MNEIDNYAPIHQEQVPNPTNPPTTKDEIAPKPENEAKK